MNGKRYDELLIQLKDVDMAEFDKRLDELRKMHDATITDIRAQMDFYEKKAIKNQRLHYIFQSIIIVGAAIVPIILGISELPKIIPIIISGIVAITIGLSNFYKFGERHISLRQTNAKLLEEFNLYVTGRGPYASLYIGEALDHFLDKTDEIEHEQTQYALSLARQFLSLEKQKQDQATQS